MSAESIMVVFQEVSKARQDQQEVDSEGSTCKTSAEKKDVKKQQVSRVEWRDREGQCI